MREIKFRGKRMDNGGRVYGDLLQGNFSMFIVDMVNTINGNKLFDLNYYEVLPETIGQFTGLHDKNGVEIYEGDKMIIPARDNPLVVIWVPELACYNAQDSTNGDCFADADEFESGEVIGNIHSNPELLK